MSEEQSRMNPARWWQREPVMFMAVIQAAIGLGISFGVPLTSEQVGQIMAFAAAVLGFIARQQVTPTSKIEAQAQKPV